MQDFENVLFKRHSIIVGRKGSGKSAFVYVYKAAISSIAEEFSFIDGVYSTK